MNIQENISLVLSTCLKIGGLARFFAEVQTEDELQEAVLWASWRRIPVMVLGAGSNVLVCDAGFDGLVVRIRLGDMSCSSNFLYAGAGASMARVALFALRHDLSGFEWAAGIPGTIGGSVYGNAGCFGGEMKDVVERVRVLQFPISNFQFPKKNQISNSKIKILELTDKKCQFDYRESVFKKHKDWIILGATLELKHVSDAEKKETQAKIQRMMRERVSEQAIGERTMGSTFKGIPLTDETIRLLQSYDKRFQKNGYSCWVFENRRGMISAGFFIEQAELKGKKIGDVSVSEKHANFLINDGAATAEQVVMLIAFIKERVHRKFGIMLEEEIQYIGF